MTIETFSTELVALGAKENFQDFYLLPRQDHYEYFFRRGTRLFYHASLKKATALQLISRFKYIGQMDVSEKRKAQLGAVSYDLPGGVQRLRLSTVGDYKQNESLVIRFIHPLEQAMIHYFLPEQFTFLTQRTRQKGLYLFCGAVGSGKTTLMYRLAKQVEGQVITIEDPVEVEESQFLQLQVNPKIQQTYDELIKLSLRHHPDVLIIGEIRDEQTAKGAIRAALTGHCVYATLHAASLESAVTRLVELGGEKNLLTDCLRGVVYQELFADVSGRQGVLAAYAFGKEKVSWSESLTLLGARDEDEKNYDQAKDPIDPTTGRFVDQRL